VSGSTFRGDPYSVLDVRHDATSEEIKKRWRDLAREHHPDRAGGDGTERARLTTRMARINAAYDVLRDPVRRARYDATPEARRHWAARDVSDRPSGGPPPPPPSRPVTARFDTTAVFHRRNATLSMAPAGLGAAGLHGIGPVEWRRGDRGRDLRASKPTGPVRRSYAGGRPHLPSLEEARSTVLGFGRFHGLTLAQVADREPAYIDWIASTITRDRDLVMRARVVAADLDERGVERRRRPAEA
jgi:curved DNA-binding protein CbpA